MQIIGPLLAITGLLVLTLLGYGLCRVAADADRQTEKQAEDTHDAA